MIEFLLTYKAVLVPLLTWLAGYLMPSPMQRSARAEAQIIAAEKKADDSQDTTDLDVIS